MLSAHLSLSRMQRPLLSSILAAFLLLDSCVCAVSLALGRREDTGVPRDVPMKSRILFPRAAHQFVGHALIGFFNPNTTGGDYVALSDVSNAYDAITMYPAAFDDDASRPTFGGVIFHTCLLPQCEDGRVEEDVFIANVKDKVSNGKLVQLGVYWDFGQHADDTAQAKFIETVTSIIDKYGFNGIDLNGIGFPTLDDGDDDFEQPTTPAVVNYLQTLRTIKAKYGDGFGLSFTISPRTLQLSSDAYGYHFNGAWLPILHALRDEISTLCIHHFDQTAVLDRNAVTVSQDSSDYWVALVDRALSGFLAGGKSFPPFPASKVTVGVLPWNPSSQDSFRVNLQNGLKCVMTGQACGTIRTQNGPFPDFLGAAGFTIEADELSGGPFRLAMRSFLDTIVASVSSSSQSVSSTGSSQSVSSTSSSTAAGGTPSMNIVPANDHKGPSASVLAPAIIVPVVVLLAVLAVLVWRRRRSPPSTAQFGAVEPRWTSAQTSPDPQNDGTIDPWTPYASAEPSPPLKRALPSAGPSMPIPAATVQQRTDTPTSGGPELERLAALQTEMGRVGLSVDALQASLSRLRSPRELSDDAASEVPPPTYVTGR